MKRAEAIETAARNCALQCRAGVMDVDALEAALALPADEDAATAEGLNGPDPLRIVYATDLAALEGRLFKILDELRADIAKLSDPAYLAARGVR